MENNLTKEAAAPEVHNPKPCAWIVYSTWEDTNSTRYSYQLAQQRFWQILNEICQMNHKWDENFNLETPTPMVIRMDDEPADLAEQWYQLHVDDTFDYLACAPEAEPAQFRNMIDVIATVQDVMLKNDMAISQILVWSDCASHHSMEWTWWGQRKHTLLEFRGERIEIEPVYPPAAPGATPLYDAPDEAFDADYRTKKQEWSRAKMS